MSVPRRQVRRRSAASLSTLIPGRMTQEVVDRFELVQVEEQDRRLAFAGRLLKLPLQLLVEGRSVQQAC